MNKIFFFDDLSVWLVIDSIPTTVGGPEIQTHHHQIQATVEATLDGWRSLVMPKSLFFTLHDFSHLRRNTNTTTTLESSVH